MPKLTAAVLAALFIAVVIMVVASREKARIHDPAGPAMATGMLSVAKAATAPANDPAALTCEEELKSLGATFETLEPIAEQDGCGAERPMKLLSVGIALKPAITTRCEVAKALTVWTRHVVIPSAELHLGAKPTAISTGDSYQCRQRRGDGEVKMSEHALANAVDIGAIELEGREPIAVMEQAEGDDAARAFQAAIRGGACAYFTTVLGPGTNAAHADHLHLDMIQRDSGYRICQ